MTETKNKSLDTLNTVVSSLKELTYTEQCRVLEAAAKFLGLSSAIQMGEPYKITYLGESLIKDAEKHFEETVITCDSDMP